MRWITVMVDITASTHSTGAIAFHFSNSAPMMISTIRSGRSMKPFHGTPGANRADHHRRAVREVERDGACAVGAGRDIDHHGDPSHHVYVSADNGDGEGGGAGGIGSS